MESEYYALSMSMREVLPLQNLTTTIVRPLGLEGIGLTEFKAKNRKEDKFLKTAVHEDNDGAMKLAKMEPGRMTPRSKHYGVEYRTGFELN
jgi:anti-sigma factor ChrR (cupin superfamily)